MAATTTEIRQKEIWQRLEEELLLADEYSSNFSDSPTIILIKVHLRLLSSSPAHSHQEIRKKLHALLSRFCNDDHPLTSLLLLHLSQ